MAIQQTLKIVNGRLTPSVEVLDASLLEISSTANNALQIKEDGLFVSSSGGSGPSELPEGQSYLTSSTGKVQRETIGVDSKHVINLHTQAGLITNLTTSSGTIAYDGTSTLAAVGLPETNAGTIGALIRVGDTLVFTIPKGTTGKMGIGISGPIAYAAGNYNTYPFILSPLDLSTLTEATTITVTMATPLMVTISATNSSGNIASVSGTFNATAFQSTLDSFGIPSVSITFILTNTNPVTVNLGASYPLEETIITPFIVYREDLKMIFDTQPTGANATAIGTKSKATAGECTSIGNAAESSNARSTSLGSTAKASGFESTSIGYSSVASGRSSVAFGVSAKSVATFSTAFGFNAKSLSSSGTAIGSSAETRSTSGVALGSSAIAGSLNSIALGAKSNIPEGNTGSVALGYSATVTGFQQVQLGGSSTTTYAYGAIQDRSDVRDKTDVQDVTLGLSFINSLRPVKYRWDYRDDYFNELYPNIIRSEYETDELYEVALHTREQNRINFYASPIKDGSKARTRYHHGLIAQELKAVLDGLGEDHASYQDHSVGGGLDVKSIGYAELIPNLIKAIQELTQQNNELKARLDAM